VTPEALKLFRDKLAEPLQQPFERAWQRYQIVAQLKECALPTVPEFYFLLWKVLVFSEYASHIFCFYPTLPIKYFNYQAKIFSHLELKELWSNEEKKCTDMDSLMTQLRRFRHHYLGYILWCDILGFYTFEQQMQALSTLADVCVTAALNSLRKLLKPQFGEPFNERNQRQSLVVLALGKLGAGELNFSSDIDLIFAYPESGVTKGGVKDIAVESYFLNLSQLLIKVLSHQTEEGFVYRVDMRLRPHGKSGALVMSYLALENYYQYQGRDWERYALIKARPITGREHERQQLMRLLKPFVYRRYLDYGAFESLREMKAFIEIDVKRKKAQNNIKLGSGGIRQIEFLAQAFQLIRGGREKTFQSPELLLILQRLAVAGYISSKISDELIQAYLFLRKLEHCLQMLRDEQTHQLPESPFDQMRIAYAFGVPHWQEIVNRLQQHTQIVKQHFHAISAAPRDKALSQQGSFDDKYDLLWLKLKHNEEIIKIFSDLGFLHPNEACQILCQFKQSNLCQNIQKRAKSRLDKLMPRIIFSVAQYDESQTLLTRVIRFIRAIARRSAYLALLIEQPKLLDYLLEIIQRSEWILDTICAYPVLLDELISPYSLEQMTDRAFLEQELSQRLTHVMANDLESQMERLRQFKLVMFLYVAVCELKDENCALKVVQALNLIAETILQKVTQLSFEFVVRHYQLVEPLEHVKLKMNFGVVAYGQLGAGEMHYGSDLDLVFLYVPFEKNLQFQGRQNLSASDLGMRLAQRIIHMLNAQTPSGVLYHVDVRLRPDGSAGLLVSSFLSYQKYLSSQAWTYEHQALVKARCVVGSSALKHDFNELRRRILCQERDPMQLKADIQQMRAKMIKYRSFSEVTQVKSMQGGLADIDFIAQYYVLFCANVHPAMSEEQSSMKILEKLSQISLLDKNMALKLTNAYQYYQKLNRCTLLSGADMDPPKLNNYATEVYSIWQAVFCDKKESSQT